jgi:hypothetical protein
MCDHRCDSNTHNSKHLTEKAEGHGFKLYRDKSFLLSDSFKDLTKKKFNRCRVVRPKGKECHRAHLQPASCWFLTWPTLWPWQWRQYILLECQWTSTRLCGVTYEMTVLFTGSVCHRILLVFTWFTYQSWRWRQRVRLKCPISIRLWGVTSQKVV